MWLIRINLGVKGKNGGFDLVEPKNLFKRQTKYINKFQIK